MRLLLAALLALAPSLAHAQTQSQPHYIYNYGPTISLDQNHARILMQQGSAAAPYTYTTPNQILNSGFPAAFGTLGATGAATLGGGGTFGGTWGGTLNLTNGLQQGGATILTNGASASNPVLFVGKGAGAASALSSDQFMVGVGPYSLANAHGILEDTCLGILTCNQITTGNYNTAAGVHALGFEKTTDQNTALGEDNMRNTVGSAANTSTGANTLRNGSGSFNVASGEGTLFANATSITLTGTATAADVVSVAFSTANANVLNVPATASYTVQSGNTLADVAAGLVSAINALNINGQGVVLTAATSPFSGGPVTIGLDFPGTAATGWAITTTPGVTGAATETVTIGGGFTGSYINASGYNAVYGAGLTTATRLDVSGSSTAPFATSAHDGVLWGYGSGYNITTDSEFALGGTNSGFSMRGTAGNTFYGYNSGYGVTGGFNTVLGNVEGPELNCITSGVQNLQIGAQVCVPSPTASGQMSIQNAIYGVENNGTGASVSPGRIGIGTKAPNATFTVGDPPSGSGPHIGVLATAAPALSSCGTSPSIDATASDTAGNVLEGSTATGCTITFEVAYTTGPHCVVTSWNSAFPISISSSGASSFTVTNSSASGLRFSYICLQ